MTYEPRPLTGRNAVVTGGAMGIGYAISARLAEHGADVAIWDIAVDAGTEAVERLRSQGLSASFHRVDVVDRVQIDAAVAAVHQASGPISIIVNNAGIDHNAPFLTIDRATMQRVIEINLIGLMECIQAVLPDLIEQQWGRVINISSSSAQRGARKMGPYSASKGGVIALTRTLALEFGDQGITVNNVPPGFIDTPMLRRSESEGGFGAGGVDAQIAATPVGRIGQPADIAAAVAFLASPDAGYITGQTFGVNGGRFP